MTKAKRVAVYVRVSTSDQTCANQRQGSGAILPTRLFRSSRRQTDSWSS